MFYRNQNAISQMSKLPVQSCRLYVTSELPKEAPKVDQKSEPALCSQVPSTFKLTVPKYFGYFLNCEVWVF